MPLDMSENTHETQKQPMDLHHIQLILAWF
jgi:hypothetical protein